jgi:hypothetical protein
LTSFSPPPGRPFRRPESWAPLVVGLVALSVYAATAARTITWWEGSEYPLAAWTLGILPPPGSLLLTLYGWLMSHIPVFHPVAFRLNLAAGLLAALTVALVTRLSIELAAPDGRHPSAAEIAAGVVVGLAFAFSLSVWTHAVQFKPYILTALFTALILTTALAWWRRAVEADAPWLLFGIFLLVGLDFSVHRTNALLIPAVLFWMALRRPRVWIRLRPWAAMFGGLALGLSAQLLLIPLSNRDPSFDLAQPRDLAGLWSYVSLKQMGGGFLLRILPRTSDFLRVQLADYAQFFRTNVLRPFHGIPLPLLPAILVLAGWALALRGDRRRWFGLLGFFLCSSLGAVIYFNLPAHYFRSMDRHYLPSLVLFAPWSAMGVAALFRAVGRLAGRQAGSRFAHRGLLATLTLLFLLPAFDSVLANRRACDLSRVRFAETYSRDVLENLPPHAILLTNGDNDTFPVWYLQQVEGVRRDVAVINIPLTNLDSYAARVRRRELSDIRFPLRLESPAPARLDTTITVPVRSTLRSALPPEVAAPDSLSFRLSGLVLPQDFFVLDLLRFGSETRPLYMACTVNQLAWLQPYLRLDGLVQRIVPSKDPALRDLERLDRVLKRISYAGVADGTIAMDDASLAMCRNYLHVLMSLADAQLESGNAKGCLETLLSAEAKVPPARLGLDPGIMDALRVRAESSAREDGAGVREE